MTAAGCIRGITIALTFLFAAEMTARVDDGIRLGIPLTAAPDRVHDLVLQTPAVLRGRPNGRFKKWRLNEFGFRSEPMSAHTPPGCSRVVVLGASETFGLYESEGNEYPAQLGRMLNASGCYEVVNAAVAGLALPGIVQLWDQWVRQFKPDIVVIYPTPAFYLANGPPAAPHATGAPAPPWWTPRLWDRAHDVIHYPGFVQRRRVERWLAEARAGHDANWMFGGAPENRLRQFRRDLIELVDRATADSARVILTTHTTAFHRPIAGDEIEALQAFNVFSPRASESDLLDFEDAAARAVVDLGAQRRIPVVNAAAAMNGHRPWFAEDFIHFSDTGAEKIASLIAAELLTDRNSGPRPTSDLQAHALQ